MRSGLLTGTFTKQRAGRLSPGDWRSRSADFRGEKVRRNLALADALVPIAARRGTTVASVAVAWTLAWQGVTGTIVGARSPTQVDGWLRAAKLDLGNDDLDDIAIAIERSGVGSGPVRPPR
jgi:aryl-alcohol dehydrogenase-like predicted oxidoreductase